MKSCCFVLFFFDVLHCVCGQYAAGMAAASQTIIIRTALSYQDLYEVSRCCFLCVLWRTDAVSVGFLPFQKRVVREESKLLSMMPLTGTNKANRTLLYSIQREVNMDDICFFVDFNWVSALIPPEDIWLLVVFDSKLEKNIYIFLTSGKLFNAFFSVQFCSFKMNA